MTRVRSLTADKVVAGALSIGSARLIAKLLAFATAILIARDLGRSMYGQYSLIVSFALIFSYIADFGLVSYLIREMADDGREGHDRLFGSGLAAQTMISILSVSALVGAGFALEAAPLVRAGIVLAGIGLFFESLGRPFSGVIIGRQRLLLSAVLIAAASIVNSVLLTVLVISHAGVALLVAVSIPVGVLSAGVGGYFAVRTVRPRLHISIPEIKQLIGASFPFALLAGSAILYDRFDVLMLAAMAGTGAVGIYSAADRVVEGLLVIPAAIGAALYPSLAANRAAASAQVLRTIRWSLPLGVLLTILGIIPGGLLVDILFGSRYPGAGSTFQLLVPVVALESVTVPVAYLFQASVRTGAAITATAVGLAVNIMLNLVLIPRFSFHGAAVSATLAEFAVLIVLLCLIRPAR